MRQECICIPSSRNHFIYVRYFSESNVDVVILEAGIGGRYSTTNFIDQSFLFTDDSTTSTAEKQRYRIISVITSISLDHQAVLGNTVEEIAWHKAGTCLFVCLFVCLIFQ